MNSYSYGTTLIELLIALTIFTLLLLMGLSWFSFAKKRPLYLTDQLLHQLEFARSKAIQLNQPVQVCQRHNPRYLVTSINHHVIRSQAISLALYQNNQTLFECITYGPLGTAKPTTLYFTPEHQIVINYVGRPRLSNQS